MNALDRWIAAVSPTAAERRARARLRLAAVERIRASFDGADLGRRGNSIRRSRADANQAVRGSLGALRAGARDLVRNNAYAKRGVECVTTNVVGAGILPHVEGGGRTDLEDLMRRHFDTPAIDAAGQHDLYGLQALVMRTAVQDGECLIRRRWRMGRDGLPLPFQVEVLEPDYLDTARDRPLESGGAIVHGVEFDALGRRVAYWLHRSHPGSGWWRVPMESRRVPAEDVAHVYRVDRPGQVRGVTWLAPVMIRLADLMGFEDAHLVRQKVAACFAAFVREPDGVMAPLGSGDGSNPERQELLEPGIIEHLAPGQDVTFANPPSVDDYEGYVRAQLRAVSAGLGVTYEALTGDLSNVNFSSARMGWLEMHRNLEAWRSQVLIPGMLLPLERWFGAALAREGIAPARLTWTPPARSMVDPTKEVPALKAAVRAGQLTPAEMVRQLGKDPDRHFGEFAADLARLDALGLRLECDPRQPLNGGAATMEAMDDDDDTDPA